MEKIQFDHSKETNAEKIGVSEDRVREIFETVREIYLGTGKSLCKDLENAVNKLKPTSAAEYLLIGFQYADIHNQVKFKGAMMLKSLTDLVS